jgi:hypothetical protein
MDNMARHIIIDFEPGHIHRMRNFGEALYHATREDGWASISLEEIDRATTQLRVTVLSRRRVRRTASAIQRLLERHHLADIARVTEGGG